MNDEAVVHLINAVPVSARQMERALLVQARVRAADGRRATPMESALALRGAFVEADADTLLSIAVRAGALAHALHHGREDGVLPIAGGRGPVRATPGLLAAAARGRVVVREGVLTFDLDHLFAMAEEVEAVDE